MKYAAFTIVGIVMLSMISDLLLDFKSHVEYKMSAPISLKLPRLNQNTTTRLTDRYSEKFLSYLAQSPPASKDLVLHGVYFDDRPRKGHSNITMIFLTINRTIFLSKWVLSCGVDSKVASDFSVQPTYQQAGRSRKFPYEQYVLECYDLSVVNGSSRAYVSYKTAENGEPEVIESKSPVMVPALRVQPTGKYNFTVATCTKAFNKYVSFLPEFVRYQRTIGVDHVHLSVLDEFITDGTLDTVMQDNFIRLAVLSGYLSFSVLKVWYTEKETFLSSSVFQRLGCFYHLRGTYDYISIADPDDFFNPRIPGETDMKYYIREHCTKGMPNIGSCRFQWRWIYPDVCGVTGQVAQDGNVTDTVKISDVEKYNRNTKSIYASKAVVDFSFHDAKCSSCMLPGYEIEDISPEVVYFAHNRLNSKRSRKLVCY